MRSFLLVIPSLLLAGTAFGQSPTPAAAHKKATPEHKAAAMVMPIRNYKLSGSPAAPLTVELYTDYECPSCRNFFMDVLPQLEAQYVATGKIQLMHRDFRLPQHQYSKLAARYANAAGEVGQYQIVAAQLFKTQQEWAANGNVDAAVAKVLSPSDMTKVRDLVKNDAHLDDTAEADEAIAAKDGLNQTPTLVIVNKGKRTKIDGFVPFNILKSYIDQMLAKRMTPANPKLLRGLLLAGRLILAGIFLAAAYFKLREPWLQFAVSLNGFKILPDSALEPVAKTLPWLELILGLAVLSGVWLRWFSLMATLMLATFFSVLVRSFALGLQVDCGCFGSGEALGPKTLVRDGVMLTLAIAVTTGAFAMRRGNAKSSTAADADPVAASSGTEHSHPV